MRILRVRLQNYRGTGDREVRLRADGITVVAGPNEAGKSSLMEAFRLALKFRDSSKAAAVKAVQPVGTDLPTEVEVEFKTGGYHLTLKRRWHRDTSTQLVVHAPAREEHAGRLADERLQEILDETVDSDLMDALHMGQDDKQLEQATPNPWGGALADALSVGRDQASCRLDTTLVDLAADERSRWLTPTGKEKKELKAFADAIRRAEARVDELRATQEELETCVVEHDRVRAQRAALLAELDQARAELDGLALRHSKLNEATAVRDRRAAEVETAETNARAAEAAVVTRRAAAQRVAELEARISAVAEAAAGEEAERKAAKVAAAEARHASTRLAERAEELEAAATETAALSRRAEAAERLAIAASQRDAEAARVEAARSAASPSLVVEMITNSTVVVDGELLELKAGAVHRTGVDGSSVVEVPGVARISVEPGAAAVELREAAEKAASVVLKQLDETMARCREELEPLGNPGVDAAAARQAAVDASSAWGDARTAATRAERAAAQAESELRELESRHQRVSDQLDQARQFLETDATDLAAARLESADEDLDSMVAAATTSLGAARAALAEADTRVTQLATDSLPERVAALESRIRDLQAKSDEARDRLSALAERARLLSDQGLHTRLQDAEAERDALLAESGRDRRRAEVADLLWSTLDRHRKDAESAYRDPLRMRIEELGRALLGPSFSVEMGHDLKVARRRLDGHTVEVGQLSAGAREQLALIGRIACASLAARDGAGAPLILDDTLGFSDPERRKAISRVLSDATGGCQVIVLTCDPERYAELEDAELVQL
ncbi:MAG TPA: AAA family ATPase [Acidimicrobiales bacterium]|nr:AAA family ATPase [Acidimicrobiales bacterium]